MALEPPKRSPESEQRLMLLLILNQLGSCSDMQLLQFLFHNDLMNYFDMMITLSDLCAHGQAVRTERVGQSFYALTPAGEEALTLFSRRIPQSLKDRIASLAPEWKTRFQLEQEYQSEYHQTKRGEYELNLRIMEQEMEMLHITLSLPSEEIAKNMKENWASGAGDIYAGLFAKLGGQRQ